MINYRTVFNPSNSYIGIIIIITLALLIIITEKHLLVSLKKINKVFFISGLIILIINVLLELIINNLIINNYKIFIEIITKNIIKSFYYYSISIIIISSFINLIIKIWAKTSNKA